MVSVWGCVCGVLLALLLLKAVSIVGAIRWLGIHGLRYVQAVPPDGFEDERDYWKVFETNGGGFFPFGAKDYKLRRGISALRGVDGGWRYLAHPVWLFQNVLYRFHRLAAIAGVVAVITASRYPHTLAGYLAYSTTSVILLMTLLLSVEAIHAYSLLGDYAQTFHMFSPKSERWAGRPARLLNLRVLVTLIATTAFAGTCAAYVALVGHDGFTGTVIDKIPGDAGGWIRVPTQLWNCFYYTVTTLSTVGYGDVAPRNFFGQLVAVLLEFQAFAMVAFVLASFFSAKETGGTTPPGT